MIVNSMKISNICVQKNNTWQNQYTSVSLVAERAVALTINKSWSGSFLFAVLRIKSIKKLCSLLLAVNKNAL